jgi:hypothetical protein
MAKKFKKGDAAKFVVPDLCGRIVGHRLSEEGDLQVVLGYVCPSGGGYKEAVFDPDQLETDPNPVELPEAVEHEPTPQTIFVEGEEPAAADSEASA